MSYFKAEMHQIRFGWGAPPGPLAGLRGPTSKGREGGGGKGRGREGRERGEKGKGEREGKGKREREREGVCTIGNRHPPDEILATPLIPAYYS